MRQSLPLSDLARAVALFSKNVHDESLPTSIQTMSCKLLLNLVECIKDRSQKENAFPNGRELLMRMNEVFVQKFKTVAKLQLPVLVAKFKSQQQTNTTPSTPTTTEPIKTEQDIKTEDPTGITGDANPGVKPVEGDGNGADPRGMTGDRNFFLDRKFLIQT